MYAILHAIACDMHGELHTKLRPVKSRKHAHPRPCMCSRLCMDERSLSAVRPGRDVRLVGKQATCTCACLLRVSEKPHKEIPQAILLRDDSSLSLSISLSLSLCLSVCLSVYLSIYLSLTYQRDHWLMADCGQWS